ncbi:MAG: T9SS type A sorting domain-containing protein [Ignavibacteria bacterium]|nr:T9SS type A sorting domain-containing protein [Ignavibacteria bacterium]
MKLPKKLVIAIIVLIVQSSAVFAQWPCNSNEAVPVVAEQNNQWNHNIVLDTDGNILFLWQDKRSVSYEQVYLQCLHKIGVTDWQVGGVQVANTSGNQSSARAIVTNGGVIVVWHDNRKGTDYDIYAQKFDKSGTPQWTVGGVAICNATGNQQNPRIVYDNQGGAIIVWQDRRNGTDNNIYAQRINANGQAQWTANGILICSAPYDQFNPEVVTDGSGGAIVAWHDYRAGSGYIDIYAQRISQTGSILWQANGIPVTTANNNQYNLQLIADGYKGAIVVWQDRRNLTNDELYGQRISPTGSILWQPNGSPIATGAGFKSYPKLASNGNGGVYVVWQDNRNGIDYNIYLQNVSLFGELLWQTDGIQVCNAQGHQYYPQITSDANGNLIVGWQDKRNGTDFDIYVQRYNANGIAQWTSNGVAAQIAPYDQIEPKLIMDEDGGAIISWIDYRAGNNYSDIYAQRIGVNGKIAGGCFRTFTQSDFTLKANRIKVPAGVPAPQPNGGNVRDTLFKRGLFNEGIILGIAKPESANVYGWIKLQRSLNVRRFLVQSGPPRPFDMRGTKYFIKELRNPTPRIYDNHLAGELLTLKLNLAASDNGLIQSGLGEIIYYDTSKGNGFNGKSIRKLVAMADSALTKWRSYPNFNYVLLDSVLTRINNAFSGPIDTITINPLKLKNVRSVYSVPYLRLDNSNPISPILTSTYKINESPNSFQLLQNYPNPFNPYTTIEFQLPEPSIVTLIIYNSLGQEITKLIDNEEMEAGINSVTFDATGLASGIYFYKLIVNNSIQKTKRMLLIK